MDDLYTSLTKNSWFVALGNISSHNKLEAHAVYVNKQLNDSELAELKHIFRNIKVKYEIRNIGSLKPGHWVPSSKPSQQ